MKTEAKSDMTDNEKRIAIAEACGWKRPDHPDVMQFKAGWSMPEVWWMNPMGVLCLNGDLPDYLNDLNAMHEAEKVIRNLPETIQGDATRKRYQAELEKACKNWGDRIYFATASQRAEAFLKTIGKL